MTTYKTGYAGLVKRLDWYINNRLREHNRGREQSLCECDLCLLCRSHQALTAQVEELRVAFDGINCLRNEALSEAEAAERLAAEREELLRRIRLSINTNGELSVLCMQDIDALLGPR